MKAIGTLVDKMPIDYISQASDPGNRVSHAHIPEPLNGSHQG